MTMGAQDERESLKVRSLSLFLSLYTCFSNITLSNNVVVITVQAAGPPS
jgi:hypothetical protein